MGIFRTSAKSELKRARKAAMASPSPLAYTGLADKHLRVGDSAGALKAIQEGLGRFPGADMLERAHGSVKRRLHEEEFRDLHRQLTESPNPDTMTDLAQLYVETGEETKALDLCARTIETFPDHNDSYLVVAEIRLRRFYKGMAIKDGLIAVANLERIIACNEQHYQAHRLLADFYVRVGMASSAVQCLKTILVFSPDDAWTHETLDEAIGLPNREEEDLYRLLQEYRERHTLSAEAARLAQSAAAENSGTDGEPLAGLETIIEKFQSFAQDPGFHAGILLEADHTLAEAASPDEPELSLEEVVRSITEVAQRHAIRMDIGNFRQGVVTGPFGEMVLQKSGPITVGALLKPGHRTFPWEQKIESLAESTVALQASRTAEPPTPKDEDPTDA